MTFLSSDNKDIAQPMELSLFASPTNQVAIEKVFFTEARPISSIGVSDTPIEIVVSGSEAEYDDLKRSKLYLKARILKADGTALAENEKKNRHCKFTTSKHVFPDGCILEQQVSIFQHKQLPVEGLFQDYLAGETNSVHRNNQSCFLKRRET